MDNAFTEGDLAGISIFYAVLATIIVAVLLILKLSIKIVRHAEVILIERFGKYKGCLKPGIHFLVPFIESPRKIHWRYLDITPNDNTVRVVNVETDRIDMREHVIDFGRQHVITKDTVQINIDALVYYQITDAELAVYKIQNLPDAIELLTQSTLRNIIAQMTLDDTFSSRELINAQLKNKTVGDAERWGVTIKRVEIMNIVPPADIKNAMENQIREERERRSTVLKADGERESAVVRSRGTAAQMVLRAEGEKTSTLQRAKGQAEARRLIAIGESESIKIVRQSIEDTQVLATEYLVASQYLSSFAEMIKVNSTNSTVVLIPSQTLEAIENIAGMPFTE